MQFLHTTPQTNRHLKIELSAVLVNYIEKSSCQNPQNRLRSAVPHNKAQKFLAFSPLSFKQVSCHVSPKEKIYQNCPQGGGIEKSWLLVPFLLVDLRSGLTIPACVLKWSLLFPLGYPVEFLERSARQDLFSFKWREASPSPCFFERRDSSAATQK